MIKHSEFVNNFLVDFQVLTPFQKNIFKYLHFLAKKFKWVYPGISRIANHVGSCTRTVKRALATFRKLGWLCTLKKGYSSNNYFINDEIISLDLDDKNIFLNHECPPNVPIVNNSSNVFIDTYTKEAKVSICKKIENRYVPEFLRIKCLTFEEQQRLANRFCEKVLYEALEYAKWCARTKKIVISWIGLIWDKAERFSKKLIL